ncbi:DUF4349 domain-containing protein [Microbacterium sp. NPDC089189]|uniref:DUF4349 domain-containing protein n=1 Tax=Microbacterium sp. NPDC089189 TaxID=3154972 RepID=UPI0034432516
MTYSDDRRPAEAEGATLPDGPSDAQVLRMERGVLREIETDRMRRRARRGRIWAGAAAAVAVVAVAALVSPVVTGTGTGTGNPVTSIPAPALDGAVVRGAESIPEGVDGATLEGGLADPGSGDIAQAPSEREVAASGWMSVVVDDLARTQERIAALAEDAGGYVESVAASAAVESPDGSSLRVPAQNTISVRVPADRLDAVVDAAGSEGEVTSSSISRVDVTDQAVDLRARIAAQETSVARLTELLAQSASVADLIAAESALADRQGALDADRQQLTALESTVSMSSLTVTLSEPAAAPQADPAGFGDGIVAGWNGLVAAANGIVIGLGFLLPWIVIVAVAGAVVWGARRLARRRRERRAAPGAHAD